MLRVVDPAESGIQQGGRRWNIVFVLFFLGEAVDRNQKKKRLVKTEKQGWKSVFAKWGCEGRDRGKTRPKWQEGDVQGPLR